uniref:Transcription factor TFIIIB component B n=2 Tax=Anthurium amnicola TaxID=1678845 RepID=A0A1D1XFI9_9ARAE
MSFDLDLLDDILPQPTNVPERTSGKFLPKARRKNEKVVQNHIPSGHPVQSGAIVSPVHAPIGLPLAEGCMDVPGSPLWAKPTDTNSIDYLQRGQGSSVGQMENACPGSDYLDDILPESTTSTDRVVGKFQPKVRSNVSKLVPPSSSPCTRKPLSSVLDPAHCAPQHSETTQEFTLFDGDKHLQRSKEKEDKVSTSVEQSKDSLIQSKDSLIQASEAEAPELGASPSGIDGHLQSNQGPSGGEAADMLSGLDLHDDFLIQSSAVEKAAVKFHPKLKCGSLTQTMQTQMSTNSCNVLHTNSVSDDAISEPLINKDPATHAEGSRAESEEMNALFDMESLDTIPSQPSVATDPETRVPEHVDLQADHGFLQGEAESELSEDTLLRPTPSAVRGVGKFLPKLGTKIKKKKLIASVCCDEEHVGSSHAFSSEIQSVKSPVLASLPDSSTSVEHSINDVLGEGAKGSALDPPSPDNRRKLDYSRGLRETDRINSGKRKYPSQEAFEGGVEDHSQGILDGGDSATITKGLGVIDGSQSFRQLRKRISVCSLANELDDGNAESWELGAEKSNDSQMVEESSHDEYTEERPSGKRAPRKPRRFQDAKEKPTRRNKKASFGSDSSAPEPQKKKFSHSTRRSKRRVDKVLLETPEEDIDPMKLRIKDLIILAEARERIAIKEAATTKQPVRDQSDSSFCNYSSFGNDNQGQGLNVDGDEADRTVQYSSTKLNYHTHMVRARSGRWSKVDTELFYQAVRQFGTDFAMIQQLFPNRTRHQIKLKFKNEERKHPLQIADAVVHRSEDHSHFELVIQRLQAQEEENSIGDAADDTMTESQTGTGVNEEVDLVKVDNEEEQEVDGWDEGHGTVNPDQCEDVFDWSQYDIQYPSSPHSMEKDEYNVF